MAEPVLLNGADISMDESPWHSAHSESVQSCESGSSRISTALQRARYVLGTEASSQDVTKSSGSKEGSVSRLVETQQLRRKTPLPTWSSWRQVRTRDPAAAAPAASRSLTLARDIWSAALSTPLPEYKRRAETEPLPTHRLCSPCPTPMLGKKSIAPQRADVGPPRPG
jgi:hypothetical protein